MTDMQQKSLTEADVRAAAEAILRAERDVAAMPPLSGRHPGFSLADAYRVQDELNGMRRRQGIGFAGYKIGLTWRSTQVACGLSGPILGRILAPAVHADGDRFSASRYIDPHVEVELAFIVARDVTAPLRTPDDALDAADCVLPALELVDHRMTPPRIVADTVAYNSAFAAAVLSSRRFRPRDIDARWVGATLSRNGLMEDSGLAAIGMGHPAASLAWLANTLIERGDHLRAGDLVLSGAFARALPMAAGDAFEADFGPCGTLGISFA